MNARDAGNPAGELLCEHNNHFTSALVVSALLLGPSCSKTSSQSKFATPNDAAKALLQAFKADEQQQITAIFGREALEAVASGDAVSDKQDREVVRLAMEQSWRWAPLGPDRQELIVGEEQWPFPVPLAKSGDQWVFDSEAGKRGGPRPPNRPQRAGCDRPLPRVRGLCRRNMRRTHTTGSRLAYTHSTCAVLPVTRMGSTGKPIPARSPALWATWLLKRRRRATQRIRPKAHRSGATGFVS